MSLDNRFPNICGIMLAKLPLKLLSAQSETTVFLYKFFIAHDSASTAHVSVLVMEVCITYLSILTFSTQYFFLSFNVYDKLIIDNGNNVIYPIVYSDLQYMFCVLL